MKKNNKGFSLVELIVVVLIMAIVAVALAPQIMKWVQNSRIATDLQTKADIEKICALAITDDAAFNCVKDGGYEIILKKDSTGVSYSYKVKDASGSIIPYTGAPGDQPPLDAFWESLFDTVGVSNFDEFQDSFTVKSEVLQKRISAPHTLYSTASSSITKSAETKYGFFSKGKSEQPENSIRITKLNPLIKLFFIN